MYLPPQFNLRTGRWRRTSREYSRSWPRHWRPSLDHHLAASGGWETEDAPEPSAEARWIAELVGDRVVGEEIDATTDHAWLVVLGYLAQALGLIAGLEGVPIEQRKGPKCGPQTKMIEFLVGILGGIEYLQDLNLAEQPDCQGPDHCRSLGARDLCPLFGCQPHPGGQR